MNYRYRIYANITQEQSLFEWMDVCRVAYNYGLREIKDWCNSRKCLVDRCSISHEYLVNRAEIAPKFYLWGLGAGEFIRRQVSF